MSSDGRPGAKFHLLYCPFDESCMMPQSEVICRFPNYKECPDYKQRLSEMKRKARILL
ncbi:MAG: hypothetical protein BAJALOKI1v1_880016 [Promethearchaeota archaeon]|nr:MAG: hypothetical protein BAJALOKI1v1_880016 [Candidatus Lokiarchaeota archaeon]